MDSVERKPAAVAVQRARRVKQQESLSSLRKGISTVLSRWTGLQMAIQNQWGGRDSLKKSEKLASDILSLFSQSKAPIYVEDLESLLHESLLEHRD